MEEDETLFIMATSNKGEFKRHLMVDEYIIAIEEFGSFLRNLEKYGSLKEEEYDLFDRIREKYFEITSKLNID